MEFFSRPDLWIAFLTLFALEIVLGIDNVVFISILSDKLPPHLRRRARILGLSLAMIFRIALLFAASWVVGLTAPLFSLGPWPVLEISGRDLILILGGAFLVYKAVTEIHHKLEGHEASRSTGRAASFTAVIIQIILLDMVFSLDSVITAVGMVNELSIMVAAVVLAIVLMMFTAGWISGFVNRHPTVKILALSFLVLIGASLIAEGFNFHIEKPFIYGPIAFAICVEALNLTYHARQAKRDREPEPEPVHLHEKYSADTPDQETVEDRS